MNRLRACVALVCLAFVVTGAGRLGAGRQSLALPAALDRYLVNTAHLTAAERTALVKGGLVAKLLEADPGKEIAVLGAAWIDAAPAAYVAAVRDIERFERGAAFRVTRRISDPPRLEDFAAMALTDDDVRDLRDCRVGNCELKLDANGLQTLRTQVRWGTASEHAEANRVFRRLALDYVTGYREGGNDRLAVYRDKDRPMVVADEFRSMIENLPALARSLPDLKRYLLDYPRVTLARSDSFLYWQETQFGLKPTIRISHLVVQQNPDQTVVASKMLYASHYFWTALELRVLIPDPARGPGFWFITVNRSRSDGLSGFLGRLVRGRVRSEVRNGALAGLQATKTALETR